MKLRTIIILLWMLLSFCISSCIDADNHQYRINRLTPLAGQISQHQFHDTIPYSLEALYRKKELRQYNIHSGAVFPLDSMIWFHVKTSPISSTTYVYYFGTYRDSEFELLNDLWSYFEYDAL